MPRNKPNWLAFDMSASAICSLGQRGHATATAMTEAYRYRDEVQAGHLAETLFLVEEAKVGGGERVGRGCLGLGHEGRAFVSSRSRSQLLAVFCAKLAGVELQRSLTAKNPQHVTLLQHEKLLALDLQFSP